MCQLTYIQVNSNRYKKILTSTLLRINASNGHTDGVGIFNGVDSLKTKESATRADLSGIIKSINDYPIIGHVRKASFGYANKKKDEFTHPFTKNNKKKTNLLVLAHNGTLEHEEDDIPTNMIDSQFFMEKFYENLVVGTSTEEAFKITIDKFSGKFAFLFFHNNNFYIARGRTATLYKTNLTIDGKPIGFCVNTELISLNFSLNIVRDILQVENKNFKFSDPVTIPIDTLYKVIDVEGTDFDSSVEKCEVEFKERAKIYAAYKTEPSKYSRNYNMGTNLQLPENVDGSSANSILIKFITNLNIPIIELDYIHYIINGVGILNTTRERFEHFLDALAALNKHTNVHKTDAFYKAAIDNKISTIELYDKGIVSFPGWVLPGHVTRRLIKAAKRKN